MAPDPAPTSGSFFLRKASHLASPLLPRRLSAAPALVLGVWCAVSLAGVSSAQQRTEPFAWSHASPQSLTSFCLYGVDSPSSRRVGSCRSVTVASVAQGGERFAYLWQGLSDAEQWFCVTAIDGEGRESDCSNWRFRPAGGAPSPPPAPESPCGTDADERFCTDFESAALGFPPDGWVSSESQRMFWQTPQFIVGEIEIDGVDQRVMTSPQTALAIQSHYVLDGAADWQNYQLRGRLMTEGYRGGIGVTLYSQAPENDQFYRLLRQGTGAFRIDPNPRTRSLSCLQASTEVVPEVGVWYQVRFEARTQADSTLLRASVWPDGEPEPAAWQAVCEDRDGRRLEGGAIGLWNDGAGDKYWDDLRAINLEDEPLGRPGRPRLVHP